MSFSDDDLKRLKEWAYTKNEGEILCLLARLEAAENCIYHLLNPRTKEKTDCTCIADWRKAAGK